MIKYSAATTNDLSDISKLFLEVYSGLLKKRFKQLPSESFVKDIMELYLDTAKKGFILAKENGKIIGFVCGINSVASLWKQALKPRRILKFFFTPRQMFIMPPSLSHIIHAHVPLMGVAKKYRLKNIGLTLSDKIIDFFKKNKVKKIFFQIPNNLVDAYVKHGCNILKRKKNWSIMQRVI